MLLGRMDYLECTYGPSCTCDHRPTFVHSGLPNFPPAGNRSCDVVLHSSASSVKKEHTNGAIPKRTKSQGELVVVVVAKSYIILHVQVSQ